MSGNYYFGKEAQQFFNIHIYRCTEQKYFDEQEADCNKYIREMGCNPPPNAQNVVNLKQHWFERYGGTWEVNETVGAITLFASPGHIGGLFSFVNNKRITKRTAHKRLFFRGKLFEFNVWPNEDNKTIYQTLRKWLKVSCPPKFRPC